jgi:NitT/TauT family transport system ATP-binding protein
MDEPFTGLDDEIKKTAAACILRHLHGRTVIMVTHNKEDIALLGGTAGLVLEPARGG